MKRIIIKYLEGIANEFEQLQLLNWLRKEQNLKEFKSYQLDWEKEMESSNLFHGGEENWHSLNSKLAQRSYNNWQKSLKIGQSFKVAAIFLFLISTGSLTLYFTHQSKNISEVVTSVIAEHGQISKVRLPDGSLVWINSGSIISYNNFFSTDNRNILLIGEAYFEVAKNDEIPLIVDCGRLKIKAIGTQFNVNAYDTKKITQIVLEEGVVELVDEQTHDPFYRMSPGDIVELNMETNRYSINKVKTALYTSWKEGILNIFDLSIEDLVKQLEKRYDQQFELDASVRDLHYTFTTENETLENILKLMKKITPIKVEQNGTIIKIEIDENRLKK